MIGPERLDVFSGRALAITVVPFDKFRIAGAKRDSESVGDDLRRLTGTAERGAHHGIPSGARQHLDGFSRLLPPGVVERDVGRALQAQLAIPLGLAMSDEGESHSPSLPCLTETAVSSAPMARFVRAVRRNH